ncbi:MAG: efflux RND transporter periplasmic adaptor subunit, partial [Steroidobacteraceae bacterium]|nr:efflux RND transporter periplasmic adaptor subunit [Deltaproteobacteria bacterium]
GIAGKSLNATFTVAGLTGQFKPSRLVSVGDMLDPQTRTLPVLFEVPNQSGRLKVGLFANVAIRTGSVAGALAVPKEALTEDEGRWFVFIQSSGEAFDRREVKIGVEDGGFVQITSGLKGDERVVTRGAYYVKQAESAAKGGADQGHAH